MGMKRTVMVSVGAGDWLKAFERAGEIEGTSHKLGSCLGCRRALSNLSASTICIMAKVDN